MLITVRRPCWIVRTIRQKKKMSGGRQMTRDWLCALWLMEFDPNFDHGVSKNRRTRFIRYQAFFLTLSSTCIHFAHSCRIEYVQDLFAVKTSRSNENSRSDLNRPRIGGADRGKSKPSSEPPHTHTDTRDGCSHIKACP